MEFVVQANSIVKTGTLIVYLAIKLLNRIKRMPPADGGKGGKIMKKIIDEINLVLKISTLLGVIVFPGAICYWLFFNGSAPIRKLNTLLL